MTLFLEKEFTGHSGDALHWKIECDAIRDSEWAWAAARVAERFIFCGVYGIPKGGLAFKKHLLKYVQPDGRYFLIVDDVLTTGHSMSTALKETAQQHPAAPRQGIVLFARGQPAPWIVPIWRFW